MKPTPTQPTKTFYPYTVKIQKSSGNSLYAIIPKQVVQALKLKQGGVMRLRLRDDKVMEAWFDA